MKSRKTGFLAFTDDNDKLIAVVHLEDRHHILYKVEEMGDDDIEDLFKQTKHDITGNSK